jgi:hypothetical protein
MMRSARSGACAIGATYYMYRSRRVLLCKPASYYRHSFNTFLFLWLHFGCSCQMASFYAFAVLILSDLHGDEHPSFHCSTGEFTPCR